MGNKRYEAEKIGRTRATLAGNRGRVKPTAQAEGVAQWTVARWRDGILPPHVTEAEVQAATHKAQGEMRALFRSLVIGAGEKAAALLPALTSAKDAAIVMGIATEKYQLVSGQPTERIDAPDFVSWLRQTPADRAKSGTNVVPEPAPDVLPVVKQN